jgi:hypothetical protein
VVISTIRAAWPGVNSVRQASSVVGFSTTTPGWAPNASRSGGIAFVMNYSFD